MSHDYSNRCSSLRSVHAQLMSSGSKDRRKGVDDRENHMKKPVPQELNKQGWMHKVGGFVKSWKRRYFVAVNDQLFCKCVFNLLNVGSSVQMSPHSLSHCSL